MALLEHIAKTSGCRFLSDLHGSPDQRLPQPVNTLSALKAVQDVRTADFDLSEWRDALSYITGMPVTGAYTAMECKRLLMEHFMRCAQQ